ncbi:T9SS type A sorting domain-containing protein [Bacteroidota bacterium]
MKKIYLLSLTLLLPLILQSQVCVNLYQGDDYDLKDRESRIVKMKLDRNGKMWFGIDGLFFQVGYFDGDTSWYAVSSSFLPDPRPVDIAFDKDDSLWIATNKGLGIVSIGSLEGRTITPDNSGLPEKDVKAVAVDSNNVKWIGFASGKVASYDGSSFVVHKEWSNSPVKVIEVAADSSIWVGLGDSPGVVRYKNGTWTLNSSVKSVPAITADKWGRVMVASGDSMIIYNGLTTRVVHAAPGNSLRDIAVGPAGGIWASSGQGLLLRSGSSFVRFSSKNSGVPAQLSDPVEFDEEGQVWFGFSYLTGSEGHSGTGYLYRAPLQQTAAITADKPSLEFCFGDSLTLSANEDRASYVWPDGSNTSTFKLRDSDTVEVAVEGDNRCFFYDTIRVKAQKVFEEEKVCAVSVDSNGRNIIIWEKTPDVATESFNIYRELTTDSFEFIKNIPVGELSVFEDKDVDPTQRSVKYKISCVDTCQNESGRSFYHRTLHLQLSRGTDKGDINLSWTAYQGLDFPHYIINRGPSPDSMTVLTTKPNDQEFLYTYTDTGVFDTMYYRISIPLPKACRPTTNIKAGTGPYVHSLSNMDDNKLQLPSIVKLRASLEIRAYPNPFSEYTRIEFSNPRRTEHNLRVYDLSGKLVREIEGIYGEEVFLKRENLDPGYYVFELKGEKFYRGKVVIR